MGPLSKGVRFRGRDSPHPWGLPMTKPIRTFAVAVALAVVTGVLVGTLVSTDEAEAGTQHTLRIPAAGSAIWNFEPGAAIFVAPVVLEGNTATIHSVKLHYWDDGPGRICVDLVRPNLKSGGKKTMSTMCTRNAVNGVRTRTDTTINPETVGPGNAVYLYVNLPGGSYGLYGVTIIYTSDV